MRRDLNLKDKHGVVQSLWTAVNEGGGWLDSLPQIVTAVIETEAWRERQDGKNVYRHKSFREFIEADPRSGCGWQVDKVRALLRDDQTALTLYEQAIVGKHGGDRKSEKARIKTDNISLDPQHGTSRAGTLRRLAKDYPELHSRVVAGDLSANAAAIEAGFRKPPKPFETIRKLLPKLTPEERQKLKEML
jgi:hypothetical protein